MRASLPLLRAFRGLLSLVILPTLPWFLLKVIMEKLSKGMGRKPNHVQSVRFSSWAADGAIYVPHSLAFLWDLKIAGAPGSPLREILFWERWGDFKQGLKQSDCSKQGLLKRTEGTKSAEGCVQLPVQWSIFTNAFAVGFCRFFSYFVFLWIEVSFDGKWHKTLMRPKYMEGYSSLWIRRLNVLSQFFPTWSKSKSQQVTLRTWTGWFWSLFRGRRPRIVSIM